MLHTLSVEIVHVLKQSFNFLNKNCIPVARRASRLMAYHNPHTVNDLINARGVY